MTEGKTVLVLGGGIGGIVAASLMRKRLRARTGRSGRAGRAARLFTLAALAHGRGPPRATDFAPDRALERPASNRYAARSTDRPADPERVAWPAKRSLRTTWWSRLAPSSPRHDPGPRRGRAQLLYTRWCQSLNLARAELRQGRFVVLVGGMPFKCPAAPYEGPCCLRRTHANVVCMRHHRRPLYARDRADAGRGPESPRGAATGREQRRARSYRALVTRSILRTPIYFKNGATVAFDLLAYVPPHRAPAVVRGTGLTGESGWVPVNRHTLESKFAGSTPLVMLPAFRS